MKIQSRRTFIQRFALALTFALLPLARAHRAAVAAEKEPVAPPPGQTPVPESDSVASAIGYHANVKDIDPKRFPQRFQKDAKNQFCRGCVNYTQANKDWGRCSILNGLVSAQGWCGSWVARG